MEGIVSNVLSEKFLAINSSLEELMLSVSTDSFGEFSDTPRTVRGKSAADLLREKEEIGNRLEQLKKENFSLRASIEAWQLTLKNKLEEFKEADLKLNDIYNQIWTERENFCSETEKFNDDYGILSEWWEKQLKFVAELENLEKKTLRNKRCQQEIQKLEQDVNCVKEDLEALQKGRQDLTVEALVEETKSTRVEGPERELTPETPSSKSVRPSDDQTQTGEGERNTVENELFSMVDMEKVRMAKRMRNRRCRGSAITGVKSRNSSKHREQ